MQWLKQSKGSFPTEECVQLTSFSSSVQGFQGCSSSDQPRQWLGGRVVQAQTSHLKKWDRPCTNYFCSHSTSEDVNKVIPGTRRAGNTVRPWVGTSNLQFCNCSVWRKKILVGRWQSAPLATKHQPFFPHVEYTCSSKEGTSCILFNIQDLWVQLSPFHWAWMWLLMSYDNRAE